VLWAYGNNEQKKLAYHDHDKRSGVAVPLLASSPDEFEKLTNSKVTYPPDAQTLHLRFDNVTLPKVCSSRER